MSAPHHCMPPDPTPPPSCPGWHGLRAHIHACTLNAVGWNSHAFLGSRAGTDTPRGMKQSPEAIAIVLSGRWMPSKILFRMPGPSSTDRGCEGRDGVCVREPSDFSAIIDRPAMHVFTCFVRVTTSPTHRPAVSSYTCGHNAQAGGDAQILMLPTGIVHPASYLLPCNKQILHHHARRPTWMVAESPSRRMTSPIKLSLPTRTSSYCKHTAWLVPIC